MHEQRHKHLAEQRLLALGDTPVHSPDREHLQHASLLAVGHPPSLRLVRFGQGGEPEELQEALLRRLPRERRRGPEAQPDRPLHLLQLLHVPSRLQVCQVLLISQSRRERFISGEYSVDSVSYLLVHTKFGLSRSVDTGVCASKV